MTSKGDIDLRKWRRGIIQTCLDASVMDPRKSIVMVTLETDDNITASASPACRIDWAFVMNENPVSVRP